MLDEQIRQVPSPRVARGLILGSAVALIAACSANAGNTAGNGAATGNGNGAGSGAGGNGSGAGGDLGEGGVVIDLGSGGDTSGTGGATGTGGGTTVIPPPVDTPVNIDECPGPIDAATAAQLQAASGAPSGAIVYPYDGTVMPIGLGAPDVQWSGGGDTVYLHLKSNLLDYKGCFTGVQNGTLKIPDSAWGPAQAQSQGADDPMTIEVVTPGSGGPLKVQMTFARGKLKGDLFYNTYTSPQAGANGAVMKLKLGNPSPEVLLKEVGIAPLGPCWSCHSLAANGGMLVAQHHQYPGGPYSSSSFDLIANPGLQPPPLTTQPSATGEMGLGAVYPDGSKVLTMGSPSDSTLNPIFPDALGNVPAMIGPKESMLLDTRSGQVLPISGWNVKYAKMPSFSPDGSLIAFNYHEDSNGHSLAIADFDSATNTASNVRVIYKHDTLFPGWPFITPDNQEVIFVLGNTPDYVSSYPARPLVAPSDLWTVDIATKAARPLSRANGYLKEGTPTYLPRPGRDEHLQYFPTMSPIAAGGYFWVFFTSRRTYGNIVTNVADDAISKKIWVTAYNIRTGDLIEDPSHPPFYLPGQEQVAGNIRAFAALEPCLADGAGCETGVDCCGGVCYNGTCGPPPPPPPGEPPPPPRCANIDEKCAVSADCCDAEAQCIRSFCDIPAPPR